jgi:hypothetical protein
MKTTTEVLDSLPPERRKKIEARTDELVEIERLRADLAAAVRLLADPCLFIVPDEEWQLRRDSFLADRETE